MRLELQMNSESEFQRWDRQKESLREELFCPKSQNRAKFEAYVHQQAKVNPQVLSVGEPLFAAWK